MRGNWLLLIVLVACPALAQPKPQDGNLWRELPREFKVGFAAGYYYGIQHGALTYSSLILEETKLSEAAIGEQANFHGKFATTLRKEWANVTYQQMADAIDDFYNDPANRRIGWNSAYSYSIAKINGKPKSELEYMVEVWRKNAAGNSPK